MSDTRVGHSRTVLLAIVAFSGMCALPAQAATWYVATNGADNFGPSCGSKKLPCRSVSKAIALAAAGDTIIVGPGRYGDLNGNATFDPAPSGEEAAEIGGGCECMIKIDKRLKLRSRDGALVTVLDAGGLTQSVVHILMPQAEGTVFGKFKKGFTIRNGTDNGLLTDSSTGTSTVRITGNVALSNPTGFDVSVEGDLARPTLVDNLALESSQAGFFLHGDYSGMKRNRALRNGAGFKIDGDAHNVTRNIAVQNTDGFQVVLSDPGLGRPAASPDPPWPGFRQNAAIANTHAGVNVQAFGGINPGFFMDRSNLYGNGDPAANCGAAMDNQDPNPAHLPIGNFSDDYWGAAAGAGANPADTAGPACTSGPNVGGVYFYYGEPAPKEITIVEKSLK